MAGTRGALGALIGVVVLAGAGCSVDEDTGADVRRVADTTAEASDLPQQGAGENPGSSGAKRPDLDPYSGHSFSVAVPSGWRLEEEDKRHGELTRTRWRDPASPAGLSIDVVEGETTPPADRATAARSAASSRPSYSELSFGPASLSSGEAFRWEYRSGEARLVAYFLNKCGAAFAIRGSASLEPFVALEKGFEEAAATLRPACDAVNRAPN